MRDFNSSLNYDFVKVKGLLLLWVNLLWLTTVSLIWKSNGLLTCQIQPDLILEWTLLLYYSITQFPLLLPRTSVIITMTSRGLCHFTADVFLGWSLGAWPLKVNSLETSAFAVVHTVSNKSNYFFSQEFTYSSTKTFKLMCECVCVCVLDTRVEFEWGVYIQGARSGARSQIPFCLRSASWGE